MNTFFKKRMLCLFLFLFVFLTACGGPAQQQSDGSDAASSVSETSRGQVYDSDSSAPSMPAIPGLELSDTVLILGDSELSLAEFNYIAAATKEDRLYYYKFLFFDFYEGTGADFSYDALLSYEADGKTVAEMIFEDVLTTAQNILACENLCDSLGVSVSEEAIEAINSRVSELELSVGGAEALESELLRLGSTKEALVRYEHYFALVDALKEHLYGKNGIEPMTEEDVLQVFESTCVRLCGGSFREGEDSEKKAEDLLKKLKSGELTEFPAEGLEDFVSMGSELFRFEQLPDSVARAAREEQPNGFFAAEVEGVGFYVLKKQNFEAGDLDSLRSEIEALTRDELLVKKLTTSVAEIQASAVLLENYDISVVPSLNDKYYD